MGDFEYWFPTTIYVEDNLFDKEQNLIWENILLNSKQHTEGQDGWLGGTLKSFHSETSIHRNDNFKKLFEEISKRVFLYSNHAGFKTDSVGLSDSWFNVNYENTYQEYHTHLGSHLSIVYYISTPEGSGDILFDSPFQSSLDYVDNRYSKEENKITSSRIGYKAEKGRLIIFPSSLSHCVTKSLNKTPRISISANYIIKSKK